MNPFEPENLPLRNKIDILSFHKELVEASAKIAEYQILLQKTHINEDFIIIPLSIKEALQSSKIEGTQTTFDEVLEYDLDKKKKNNDAQEVLNYFEALNYGKRALARIPISSRFFKELHQILLGNRVRGANKAPGEFRKIQNFIGPEGCSMKNAVFIPPTPNNIQKYMSNLEKYINEPNDDLHPVIRIAIIHAQFETIHPFLDGNGRIGRILIPLYLFEQRLIHSPNLFISESLEKDKMKYYRLLNDTRTEGNWNVWIKFFINSVNKQTSKNIKIINKIDKLYEQDLQEISRLINSSKVIPLLKNMFQKPIFDIKTISDLSAMPYSTCRKYLDILERNRIVYSDNKKRNKKFYYYNLIDLLR